MHVEHLFQLNIGVSSRDSLEDSYPEKISGEREFIPVCLPSSQCSIRKDGEEPEVRQDMETLARCDLHPTTVGSAALLAMADWLLPQPELLICMPGFRDHLVTLVD